MYHYRLHPYEYFTQKLFLLLFIHFEEFNFSIGWKYMANPVQDLQNVELLQDIEYLKVLAFLNACSSRFKVGLKDLSLVFIVDWTHSHERQFKNVCSLLLLNVASSYYKLGI